MNKFGTMKEAMTDWVQSAKWLVKPFIVATGITVAWIQGVQAKDYSCEELSQIDIFTPQWEAQFNALSPEMQDKTFICTREAWNRAQANADRMNANADRINISTNRMLQITAIMEMVSWERTLSNNEMYTALTAIANDANELWFTKEQSSLLQDLALSYTNGGNGPLVVSDKAKTLFRSFIQKIKSQNLVLANEEKTRRFNAVIDTVLQYL